MRRPIRPVFVSRLPIALGCRSIPSPESSSSSISPSWSLWLNFFMLQSEILAKCIALVSPEELSDPVLPFVCQAKVAASPPFIEGMNCWISQFDHLLRTILKNLSLKIHDKMFPLRVYVGIMREGLRNFTGVPCKVIQVSNFPAVRFLPTIFVCHVINVVYLGENALQRPYYYFFLSIILGESGPSSMQWKA